MTSRDARAHLAAVGALETHTHPNSGRSVAHDSCDKKVCLEHVYCIYIQACVRLGVSPIPSYRSLIWQGSIILIKTGASPKR